MDEQIPLMNHLIWATDGEPVDAIRAKALKARYYGEITYIDQCLGRILDALAATGQRENTLVVFYSDHGEGLGDHHAQKESFFEQSTRVPFIASWPAELPAGERRDELVSLTDLFGIATAAAGDTDLHDGVDVLGALRDGAEVDRDRLFGYHGEPGTRRFTMMVRDGDWKYVFIANGGREQLFDLARDPDELVQRIDDAPDVAHRLRRAAADRLAEHDRTGALDGDDLREFPYEERDRSRVHQQAAWKGVCGFPDDPGDELEAFSLGSPSAHDD